MCVSRSRSHSQKCALTQSLLPLLTDAPHSLFNRILQFHCKRFEERMPIKLCITSFLSAIRIYSAILMLYLQETNSIIVIMEPHNKMHQKVKANFSSIIIGTTRRVFNGWEKKSATPTQFHSDMHIQSRAFAMVMLL